MPAINVGLLSSMRSRLDEKLHERKCSGNLMKRLSPQNYALMLLFFTATIFYLIQVGFRTNVNSQGMIRLSKEKWENGEYFNSINWYQAAYSSAAQSGLRWEIFKIYSYRIGKLREQGNISAACVGE
jgi:hypothetical protein